MGRSKAITVRQPWAWSIFRTGKDVENRSWRNSYRGSLFIHASQKKHPEEFRAHRLVSPISIDSDHPDLVYGAIIGVVDLVDIVKNSMSIWAARGQWHWILKNSRLFEKPVPCRGHLGLWVVSEETMASILQMQAD